MAKHEKPDKNSSVWSAQQYKDAIAVLLRARRYGLHATKRLDSQIEGNLDKATEITLLQKMADDAQGMQVHAKACLRQLRKPEIVMPAKPEPAEAEPTEAEPTEAEPTEAEPTEAELIETEAELVEAEAKAVEAMVTPEPVTPEPVTPEPVTPEPVTPEPVTPEPVTIGAKPTGQFDPFYFSR